EPDQRPLQFDLVEAPPFVGEDELDPVVDRHLAADQLGAAGQVGRLDLVRRGLGRGSEPKSDHQGGPAVHRAPSAPRRASTAFSLVMLAPRWGWRWTRQVPRSSRRIESRRAPNRTIWPTPKLVPSKSLRPAVSIRPVFGTLPSPTMW